jgi:hypothetical protein
LEKLDRSRQWVVEGMADNVDPKMPDQLSELVLDYDLLPD